MRAGDFHSTITLIPHGQNKHNALQLVSQIALAHALDIKIVIGIISFQYTISAVAWRCARVDGFLARTRVI